jgi:hypothetical protein
MLASKYANLLWSTGAIGLMDYFFVGVKGWNSEFRDINCHYE